MPGLPSSSCWSEKYRGVLQFVFFLAPIIYLYWTPLNFFLRMPPDFFEHGPQPLRIPLRPIHVSNWGGRARQTQGQRKGRGWFSNILLCIRDRLQKVFWYTSKEFKGFWEIRGVGGPRGGGPTHKEGGFSSNRKLNFWGEVKGEKKF